MVYKIAGILISCQLFMGCATGTAERKSNAEFQRHGQAPTLDLGSYASMQSRPGPQNPQTAVAAAISGGGHRAANFGVGALLELEDIRLGRSRSNALQEIDYFSTVSGGGFAAGSYLTTLHDYLASSAPSLETPSVQNFSFGEFFSGVHSSESGIMESDEFCSQCTPQRMPVCVRRNLERGYRAPVLQAFLKPKVWFTHKDRGDYLEEKIDSKLLGACWRSNDQENSMVLGDVMPSKSKAPTLPFWVTNSTVYANGAIFPFSPDILARYNISGVDHRVETRCIGSPKGDCFASYDKIPVSVGVKASASFPGAIPASTLESSWLRPKESYVHLVDGGVSDNLGILTAISLLRQDDGSVSQPISRKIIFVIDAFKSNQEPFSNKSGSPNAPAVLWHLTNEMSLSSWRGRHMNFLDRYATSAQTSVVYINFDSVKYDQKENSVSHCKAFDDDKLDQLSKKVATDFNLSLEQQQVLLCAGRVAVKSMKSCILEAFEGSSPVICGR